MSFDLLVSGIAAGAAYALVALGIVLIYKGTRVINFAQGEFGTIALFIAWTGIETWGWSYWMAAGFALLSVAVLGLIVERIVVRPLLDSPRIAMLVATVGLVLVFGVLEAQLWGVNPKIFPAPISGRGFELGSALLTPTRILTVVAAFAIGGMLWLLLRKTTFGLGVLAAAEDPATVPLVGLPIGHVSGFTWAAGAVVAGVGGLLLAPAVGTFQPLFMTSGLTKALAAALIGGLTSVRGAFVGGLLVGVTEAMILGLFPQKGTLVDGAVFVLILAVLLLRPQGLFGAPRPIRSGTSVLRMRRSKPLVPPKVAIGALAAAVIAIPMLSDYDVFIFAWMLIAAIVALSLNLLTGYAGQISLGHGAFLGAGAAVAAYLSAIQVWSFAAAIPVAAAAGALTGALVGLPALRIRGMELAVTTLAFAAAFEKLLLPEILGGRAGLEAERPWLGINFIGNTNYAYLALGGLVIIWWLDRNFTNSRLGRAVAVTRDDETVASSLGISPGYHKLFAFALAGGIAGFAGGLLAYLLQLVSVAQFPMFLSLTFIAAVVVGGLGSRAGVIIGAASFVVIPQLFEGLRLWGQFLGGALVIATVIKDPGGVAATARTALSHLLRRIRPAPVAPAVTATLTDASFASVPLDGMDPRARIDGPLLSVRGLRMRFGGQEVLSDVAIEINAGTIVGIIGPNGAGKTTLFDCIGGYLTPQAGTIFFDGRAIGGLAPHRRAQLGIARTFQSVGLARSETVLSNLLMGQHGRFAYRDLEALLRTPRVRREERRARAEALAFLDALGLGGIAHEQTADLPHGTLKLVELACAIVSHPRLLLLDETSSGMGPGEVAQLARLIKEAQERFGVTIVMIEHHVPLVLAVCDHVYAIDFGRQLTDGTPAEVARHPDVVAAYVGAHTPAPEPSPEPASVPEPAPGVAAAAPRPRRASVAHRR